MVQQLHLFYLILTLIILQNSESCKDIQNFCSCNENNCRLYNDCCLHVKSPKSAYIRPNCKQIPNTNKNIYIVDSCPPNWKDTNTRLLCNKDAEKYHYSLDLPFQSAKTQIIYANTYCASCNDDYLKPNQINFTLKASQSIVTQPEIKVKKNVMVDEFYQEGALSWYQPEPNSNRYLIESIFNNDTRYCYPHLIDKCAENWTDVLVKKQCEANYTSVFVNGIGHFKNQYCAICNYKILGGFHLPTDKSPFERTDITYTVLLDFSIKPDTCPVDMIYDMLSDECILTLCGKDFRKINNKCISMNLNKTLGNNCQYRPISIDEFEFLTNSTSIVIKKTRQKYTQNEYEAINSTVYKICIHIRDSLFVRTFPYSYSRLTIICMTLSLICLTAHLLIHCITGRLKKTPGKNQFNLSVTLLFAQLLFFVGIDETQYPHVCFALGVLIHFFYLSVFFWMNVMAFDIYKTLAQWHQRGNQRKTFYFYMVYAWFVPFIIVSLAVIVDLTEFLPNLKPRYGYKMCWVSSRFALFIFFGLPLLILLIENVCLFSLTAYGIHQTTNLTKHFNKTSECRRFYLYLKLAFIMGGTWIFGLAANLSDYEPLWYGFIILNASQGTFIFVVFTLKRGILRNLCEKLTGKSVVRKSSTPITSLNTSTKMTSLEEGCVMLPRSVSCDHV